MQCNGLWYVEDAGLSDGRRAICFTTSVCRQGPRREREREGLASDVADFPLRGNDMEVGHESQAHRQICYGQEK